ncbi:efflux transporter outer membrane subunit [Sphingomonas paeninsulae]|uniref:Efflux transporter outer membrane subunit n=1 Tax=Sphingomonas paeninsulae TaxID=2319844 RepID=A0A494TK90_SPHPE|nr:efflux transporter outer membrane subunit [Sphingomonas paeninsulae]AYJ85838.1 efflux transporter outer membrane subunit [Sphingomonas paeninsulae]
MRKSLWLPLPLVAVVSACSMAPAYYVPTTPAAVNFKEEKGWAVATPLDREPRGDWWKSFNDPLLNDLEARSEAASPTVAAAVARYDQAVALADRAGAERLPEVSIGPSIARERVSAGRPLSSGSSVTYTDRTLAGSFDWEIDLWGRLRGAARAGRADAAASEADLASVRLSLHAGIADTYFRLRGLDAQADLLLQTSKAYARAFELTDIRHSGGIASGLDTSRAQSQLSDARAQLATIALDRANAEHQLAVLVGETPSTFSVPAAIPDIEPMPIAAGIPSELLQRRPDIAAAERRVAAANERIGVARAAQFPSLTLGLSGGYQSTGGSLISAANSFWALGPLALLAPVFDGGRRKADIRQSRAVFEETAADYRSTVLGAFREVEDGLAAAHHLADAEREQDEAARASARTTELALIRYRDGASDYLEVVVAQTASLLAQRTVLTLRTQRLQTSVALIRALGGEPHGQYSANLK